MWNIIIQSSIPRLPSHYQAGQLCFDLSDIHPLIPPHTVYQCIVAELGCLAAWLTHLVVVLITAAVLQTRTSSPPTLATLTTGGDTGTLAPSATPSSVSSVTSSSWV